MPFYQAGDGFLTASKIPYLDKKIIQNLCLKQKYAYFFVRKT